MELKLNNLTTGYGVGIKENVLLQQNMTASIKPGQLTCLLGPNGAGKSTLLRTLAGFQKPLSGDILYDDTPLRKLSLKVLSHKVSVVLTDYFTDSFLTVFDVVRIGRFPHISFWGRMEKSDIELIDNTLVKLGIYSLRQQLFCYLSDGERQKVLIARALVQETPVLLLDEPVAFIDSPGRIEIMELLRGLAHEENKTVFMTTHDIESALHFADVLWLMNKGKPLRTGIPEDMVLEGTINSYFRRKGLYFNGAKGRFLPKNSSIKKDIVLCKSDDKLVLQWLVHAFERKNYFVITHEKEGIPKYSVVFRSSHFELFKGKKKIGEYEHIYNVLDGIENVE